MRQAGNLTYSDSTLFLTSIFTLFSCMKETVQSCGYVRLSGRGSPRTELTVIIYYSVNLILLQNVMILKNPGRKSCTE